MEKEKERWVKSHWLSSRGGRDWSDLLVDENGEYVLMGNAGGGQVKVYLPTVDVFMHTLKLKLPTRSKLSHTKVKRIKH
jgi:hypothetical protein